MGNCCARPAVSDPHIDVRARYSLDSPRNHEHADATPAGDTVLSVLQRGRLGGASVPGTNRARSGSRSQHKHQRASSLGSSAGAPYQLQLLPQGALLQQQQQHGSITLMHPALLAASSADQPGQQQQPPHRHHHQQQQQQQMQHAHEALVQQQQHHHHLLPVPIARVGSRHAAVAAGALQRPVPTSNLSRTPPDALSPECVLSLCAALLEEEPELAAGGINALLLAALCLIESGGRPAARQHREHVGGVALGLCQMLLSTAQWLASCRGFDRFSSPSAADLQGPKCCVYFAAAYLSTLSQHDGSPRSECFLVRAYHAGPKGVDSQAAAVYWQKFLKAKHCLTEVTSAMCVTLATAAAAAGLQVQPPSQQPPSQQQQPAGAASEAGAVAAAVTAYAEEGDDLPDCAPVQDLCSSKQHAAAGAAQLAGGKAGRHWHCSSSHGGGDASKQQQQLSLPQAAAGLVAVLACSWEGQDVPPGCPGHAGEAAAAGSAAAPVVSLSAGPAASHGPALITHMLPGLWHSPNTHSKAGQQQQQQQQVVSGAPAGSGGSGTSRRRRPGLLGSGGGGASNGSSNGSSSGSPAGMLPLVTVSRGAAEAALQRLGGISPLLLSAALSNADAAVAVAASVARAPSAHGAASFFTTTCSSSGQGQKAGAPPGASSSSGSDSGLAAWPCVMHVVGHSESLSHIAAVCGVGVADILSANPDLPGPGGVQAHDCIALPLPVVPPRLYVVQCGDSLHAIAKAHRVPLGRLLAKNPELSDPSCVQPGWVVALPGLKGDSKTGTPLGWLLEAAAAAEAEAAAAAADAEAVAAAEGADAAALQEAAELEEAEQGQQQVSGGAGLPVWQPDQQQQQQQLVSPFTAASQRQQRAAPASGSVGDRHDGSSQGSALPAFGSGAFMFAVDGAVRHRSDSSGLVPWRSHAL